MFCMFYEVIIQRQPQDRSEEGLRKKTKLTVLTGFGDRMPRLATWGLMGRPQCGQEADGRSARGRFRHFPGVFQGKAR